MTTYTSAVEISHLRKTYGNLVAVNDVSVSVAEGKSSAFSAWIPTPPRTPGGCFSVRAKPEASYDYTELFREVLAP
jgi:hypothetical protein